jgi:hypothetical protein
MKLKNIPSWLKGGLIAEGIFIILGLVSFLLMISSWNIMFFPKTCLGYEAFPAPTIIPLWCDLFFGSAYSSLSWFVPFISWFVVGALIGWIAGKIKSSKKK